jgi:hypothetical protein
MKHYTHSCFHPWILKSEKEEVGEDGNVMAYYMSSKKFIQIPR